MAIGLSTLAHYKRVVLFQCKLLLGRLHVLLFLGSVMFAIILSKQPYWLAYDVFYTFGEALFPPVAASLFVTLILQEKETGVLPLVYLGHYSLPGLYGIRAVIIFIYLCLLLFAIVFGFSLTSMETDASIPSLASDTFPLAEQYTSRWVKPDDYLIQLSIIFAPTLFLAGLGSLIAHLVIDSRAGYMVIFVMWLFTRGTTALEEHSFLYLINLSIYIYGKGDWITPKLFQAGLGFTMLVLSVILLKKSERLFT